jgi:hypothetical protein
VEVDNKRNKTGKAFICFVCEIDKCQKKVWKKGEEFEEGKKDLSSKRSFSHPQNSTTFTKHYYGIYYEKIFVGAGSRW